MNARGVVGLAAIFTLSLVTWGAASQPARSENASTACGRQCLTGVAKSYLAAVVAGNPSAVPLAANIAFVENVTRMKPGEGLWANAASGPTGFAIYVPDTEQQQVGFLGVMEREGEQGDQPVIVAVRLKLEGGAITEAEHIIAAANAPNMARLQTPRAGLRSEVPAGSRQSHADLAKIGLSYYDAWTTTTAR